MRATDGHLFPLRRIAATQIEVGQPRSPAKPQAHGGRDRPHQRSRPGFDHPRRRKALATANLLPADIDYDLGGLYQQQQIAFRGLIAVFPAALALVFLLLLFLYKEFAAAMAILISSLLAMAGVFTGLWWPASS